MKQDPRASNGPTAISLPLPGQRQRIEIRKLMVVLAETRQASISDATLNVYSKALEGHEVQDARRKRREAEQEIERRAREAAEEAHRREYPEEYTAAAEVWREVVARR